MAEKSNKKTKSAAVSAKTKPKKDKKSPKKDAEKKKVGPPMAYETPEKLQKAVDGYFNSISYMVPLRDLKGEPILNLAKKPIEKLVYATPPMVSQLCLCLGISPRTWENYCDPEKHPEFIDIVAVVRLKMLAYRNEIVLTREKGSLQGVIFDLQHNYGWKDKKTVELGEETVDALGNLSLTEKMAMVAALKSGELDIPEPIEDDEDDDE